MPFFEKPGAITTTPHSRVHWSAERKKTALKRHVKLVTFDSQIKERFQDFAISYVLSVPLEVAKKFTV